MLYVSHISVKCEGEGEEGNTPLPTLVYVNARRGRGQWTGTQCPAETHHQNALKCTVPRWGCFATTGFFPCGLSFCHCLMVLGPFKPICCYSVAQLCPTLCNPMDCSRPGFPVLHYQEFAQIHVHWVDNVITGNQKQVVVVLVQPQRNEGLSPWLL